MGPLPSKRAGECAYSLYLGSTIPRQIGRCGFYVIYVRGLMRLFAAMGLYDVIKDVLLWRTADPRCGYSLFWGSTVS